MPRPRAHPDYSIRIGHKTISLPKAREALLKRYAWRGLKPAHMREKLLLQWVEFELLKRANDLKQQGNGRRAISEEVGRMLDSTDFSPDLKKAIENTHPRPNLGVIARSAKGIEKWFKKETLPRHLSFARAELHRRSRKLFVVRKNAHADFAYVIGAYFGDVFSLASSKQKTGETGIKLSVKDREFVSYFSERFSAAFGEKPAIKPDSGGKHRLETSGVALMQLLNRITNYGSVVPAGFLKTKAARREFLRALFDSRAWVVNQPSRRPTIKFITKNQSILQTVSTYLREQGVKHSTGFTSDKFHQILIGASASQVFAKAVGFRAESKQAKLNS